MNLQTVHIILPSGTRYERIFRETDSPEQILKALNSIKNHFGYNGTVKKSDPDSPIPSVVDFADAKSGFVFDNPKTIVCVLKKDEDGNVVLDEKGIPVEEARLKGPVKE